MADLLDQSVPPQLTTLRTQGVLGAGSFGKVFKVLDVSSQELYALKLQRRDSTTKFAIREAQALHRWDRSAFSFLFKSETEAVQWIFYRCSKQLEANRVSFCMFQGPAMPSS